MPYTQLILTAGISLFAPSNLLGGAFRKDESPLEFPKGKQQPISKVPDEKLPAACREWAERTWSGQQETDLTKISAEVSLLNAIRHSAKGMASSGAIIHLLHTPSLSGRLAAQLQKDFIARECNASVHLHELHVPFDPAIPGGLRRACGAFIHQLCQLFKHVTPHQTAFAPIGGYKSMVALGHTAASFYGLNSFYLHEDSQQLQEIPTLPSTLPQVAIQALAPVVRKLVNTQTWDKMTPEEQDVINRYPAFFTRVDDLIELNELGYFLQLETLPVLLSPDAQKALTKSPEQVEGQLNQLRTQVQTSPDHPANNHHFKTIDAGKQIWNLAKMGKGHRIAWKLHHQALLIRMIWTDHDLYENEAKHTLSSTLPSSVKDYHRFS